MTVVLGLTGSIGTGKSTVTRQFAQLGAKTLDTDAVVHRLMRKKSVASQIARLFPEAVTNHRVDRARLGDIVFSDPKKLENLEAVLHPLVIEEEEKFVLRQRRRKTAMVVLDIPLLFETGAQSRVDLVVATTCPPHVQRQRVLARPGMTEEKFRRILARQIPDAEKCRRADFVIQTGLGKRYSLCRAKEIMEVIHAA